MLGSLNHRFVFQILLICASGNVCFAIFGGARTDDAPPPAERIAREPMPLYGFPSPMMQGPPGGYAGRSGGGGWPTSGTSGTTTKPKYNETYSYSKYNETKIYESEYYEPNYCEYILVEELTRGVKYLVALDLEGKFSKLTKIRYGVKVTSVMAELVFEALYEGLDLVETIAEGLKVQYGFIPGTPTQAIKDYEAERFKDKVKYTIKDVLNGICSRSYCCLESNDYYH